MQCIHTKYAINSGQSGGMDLQRPPEQTQVKS
jgi:hypothetical protein